MSFNTGNPVGSTDARDLSDNAENFDRFANGSDPAYNDRLGNSRKSISGMNDEFDSDQADRTIAFTNFLASSGYEFLGDYAAGIEVTAFNQVIRESGEFWRASAGTTLPYTTVGGGMPEGGAFVAIGDAYLRQQLVDPVATYESVAQMKLDANLATGRKARTLGYYTPGDGGGNDYEIVAGGTGTADGGSFIDLNNGLQAKGLFPSPYYDVRQWGVSGDGSDEITAALNAKTYVESLVPATTDTIAGPGYEVLYLGGLEIGVTGTIEVNRKILVTGGALQALSGFSGVSGNFILHFNGASAERAGIYKVDFDGGLEELTVGSPGTWDRYANCVLVQAPRVQIDSCFGVHFPDYGIRLINESQESKVTNTVMREWRFSEQGTEFGSLRTAKAFSFEDADCVGSNLLGAQSLYPLYSSGALNLFTGCHFYNGASTDTSEDVSVYLDNTDNNVFTGCYFDNGRVEIVTSFNHNFAGCHFQLTAAGTNTSGIFTNTTASNDDVDGLTVTGCTFNGSFPSGELAFGGSGTYVDDIFKRISWVGNCRSDGNTAWHDAKFGLYGYYDFGMTTLQASSITHTMRSNKSITFSADYDDNSSSGESEIIFDTDGTTKWKVTSDGTLFPNADNTHAIGATGSRMRNVHSNLYSLKDGVVEPGTTAGTAVLFVDSADGDLKVKFGDGVVKTIVTDV